MKYLLGVTERVTSSLKFEVRSLKKVLVLNLVNETNRDQRLKQSSTTCKKKLVILQNLDHLLVFMEFKRQLVKLSARTVGIIILMVLTSVPNAVTLEAKEAGKRRR